MENSKHHPLITELVASDYWKFFYETGEGNTGEASIGSASLYMLTIGVSFKRTTTHYDPHYKLITASLLLHIRAQKSRGNKVAGLMQSCEQLP